MGGDEFCVLIPCERGEPDQLESPEIPLGARIIGVCDPQVVTALKTVLSTHTTLRAA